MRKRDPSGCQSLERGIAVLRRLAVNGTEGMRLVDIQSATGLTRGTTHRILSALSCQGLVEQDFETRRYRIGSETNLISSDYGRWAQQLRSICRGRLRALSDYLGDTILLLARSGKSSVCVDRLTGDADVQPLTVEVGTRRPIYVGSGGIAMTSALPDHEAKLILAETDKESAYFRYATRRTIQTEVSAARKRGYAFSNGFVRPNVCSIGVAICGKDGLPIGALCVAGVSDRFKDDAIGIAADRLKTTRREIEDQLATLV